MTTQQEVFQPATAAETAAAIDAAAVAGRVVRPRGGGTHDGLGHRVAPDLVLDTSRLAGIEAWSPEDLTVVVGAGTRVADLEETLAKRKQSAVLPEHPGEATVGGVVASGVSGWRRLYYGPTRDRVLEVVLATGDGRVVRGGGRVVKNVSGYDLPRLATGSLGSLGVITSVALKLWPDGEATATVTVADPAAAAARVFRPLAIIEDREGTSVYLKGTIQEVEAQAAALAGTTETGLHWPSPLDDALQASVRVPAALTPAVVARLPETWPYQAAHGVGEVRVGIPDGVTDSVGDLRAWAEANGGSVVLTVAGPAVYEHLDPWGMPPPSLALQRRVKEAFDPLGACNPGILPGGL